MSYVKSTPTSSFLGCEVDDVCSNVDIDIEFLCSDVDDVYSDVDVDIGIDVVCLM